MDILLNILKEEQDKSGYLSEDALKRISTEYNVPLSRLYGVASFYTMLKLEPQGKFVIEICSSPSCILNSGAHIEKALEKELGIKAGETTKDNQFTFYKTSCIGWCEEAPAMLINGEPHTKLTEEKIKSIIADLRTK